MAVAAAGDTAAVGRLSSRVVLVLAAVAAGPASRYLRPGNKGSTGGREGHTQKQRQGALSRAGTLLAHLLWGQGLQALMVLLRAHPMQPPQPGRLGRVAQGSRQEEGSVVCVRTQTGPAAPLRRLLLCLRTTCPSAAAIRLLLRAPGRGWCLGPAPGTRCGAPRCALPLPPTATGAWQSSGPRALLPLLVVVVVGGTQRGSEGLVGMV